MESDKVRIECEPVGFMGETVPIGEEREALGNAVLVVPAPIVLGVIELVPVPIVLGLIELEDGPIVLDLIELVDGPIVLEDASECSASFASKSVPAETELLAPSVPGTAPAGAGRPGRDRHDCSSSRCSAASGWVSGSRSLFSSVVSVMPLLAA